MWKNSDGDYRRAPHRTPSRPKRGRFESSSDEEDEDENNEVVKEIYGKMNFVVNELKRVTDQQEKLST
jgi:hypothetical protein